MSRVLKESVEVLGSMRVGFAQDIGGRVSDTNIIKAYNDVVRDAYGNLDGVPMTPKEHNLLRQLPLIQII